MQINDCEYYCLKNILVFTDALPDSTPVELISLPTKFIETEAGTPTEAGVIVKLQVDKSMLLPVKFNVADPEAMYPLVEGETFLHSKFVLAPRLSI